MRAKFPAIGSNHPELMNANCNAPTEVWPSDEGHFAGSTLSECAGNVN